MCGRYYIDDADELYQRLLAEMEPAPRLNRERPRAVRGEVSPWDIAPVVGPQGPAWMQWGFSRQEGKGLIINARSETAAEKPTFREPMETGRCLIPASAYFEWEDAGGQKTKYRLRPQRKGPFYMAGLCRREPGRALPAFVILTAPAASGIRFIHPRMPLILPEEGADAWLKDASAAQAVIAAAEGDTRYEAEQLRLPI